VPSSPLPPSKEMRSWESTDSRHLSGEVKQKQKVNEIGIIIHLQRLTVTRQKQRKTDGFSRCVLLLYKLAYYEQLGVQKNK
jgi:hypothetical protein